MPLAYDHVFESHGGHLCTHCGPRRMDGDVWVGCPPDEAEVWGVYFAFRGGLAHWLADAATESAARLLARSYIASQGFVPEEIT